MSPPSHPSGRKVPWQQRGDACWVVHYCSHALQLETDRINVSTECLKWCPMLWQMRESALRQTLKVRVTRSTQKIQSSDWPKRCVLWRYFISCLLLENWTSFKAVCQYVYYVYHTQVNLRAMFIYKQTQILITMAWKAWQVYLNKNTCIYTCF